VIRTFVRDTNSRMIFLKPTFCFGRTLTLEMAEADRRKCAAFAVYEIDLASQAGIETVPFAAYGSFPKPHLSIGRDARL